MHTDPTTGVVIKDVGDNVFPLSTWLSANTNSIIAWMKARMNGNYSWADATARGNETGMVQGSKGYQRDTKTEYLYDSTLGWVIWNMPKTAHIATWTNLTVGNGVQSGYYEVVNGTVKGHQCIVLGSTSVMASTPSFSAPPGLAPHASYTSYRVLGPTYMRDTSAGDSYFGFCFFGSGLSSITPMRASQPGAYTSSSLGAYSGLTLATPFTANWATGDTLDMMYEYPLVGSY